MPPIVHSRHPLWDQDDLTSGDERTVGLLQGLARWPLTWRAALVTSTNHAEPEEVIRVSGPSIWPFVAACGTVLLFIGEMIHRLALIGFSVVVLVVAVVMWNRPEPVPTSDEEEEAFEAEHDIPVRTDGGRTLASWGWAWRSSSGSSPSRRSCCPTSTCASRTPTGHRPACPTRH